MDNFLSPNELTNDLSINQLTQETQTKYQISTLNLTFPQINFFYDESSFYVFKKEILNYIRPNGNNSEEIKPVTRLWSIPFAAMRSPLFKNQSKSS